MVRICRFSGRRCFFGSCDYVDSFGDIHVCVDYNGGDKFTLRKLVYLVGRK